MTRWALALNHDPHAAGGASDHADRVLRVASVEVFPLLFDDLGEMRLRDLADLFLVGHARALGDPRLDLQECRGRRTLALEFKRTVAIDRHDHGNRNAIELACPLVELRYELPQVDTELTERGTHRR